MINLEMIGCLKIKNSDDIIRIYEKEFMPNEEEEAINIKLNGKK
jgi:hypothetical protein